MSVGSMTYRAVIVGLGFIGAGDQVSGDRLGQLVSDLDGTHAEALSKHPDVHLAAGSSRDTGRRERFAARTGCRVYADWREMLEREQPEIVSVATYAPQHAEIVVASAEMGVRAVYCEKPLATRLPDAERMLSACRKAGTILAVNHNRRYAANYHKLRQFIADDGLGRLTSASLQWGSGRLGNVGTHFLDAAVFVINRRIIAVSGTLDLTGRPDCRGPEFRDPGGWGWLRLATKAGDEPPLLVCVDAADEGKLPARLIINGTAGRVVTGDTTVSLEYFDGRRVIWPAPEEGGTSMDRAVAQIIAALDGEQPFPHDPADSAHVLEAIIGFHASHRKNGAWVSLPLTGSDREIEVHSG